jgi:hypothetical protein
LERQVVIDFATSGPNGSSGQEPGVQGGPAGEVPGPFADLLGRLASGEARSGGPEPWIGGGVPEPADYAEPEEAGQGHASGLLAMHFAAPLPSALPAPALPDPRSEALPAALPAPQAAPQGHDRATAGASDAGQDDAAIATRAVSSAAPLDGEAPTAEPEHGTFSGILQAVDGLRPNLSLARTPWQEAAATGRREVTRDPAQVKVDGGAAEGKAALEVAGSVAARPSWLAAVVVGDQPSDGRWGETHHVPPAEPWQIVETRSPALPPGHASAPPAPVLDAPAPTSSASAPAMSLGGPAVPPSSFERLVDSAVHASRPSSDGLPDEVPEQMVKAMQWQWRSGVGEARFRLRPEHLGEITVSLRVERGTVTAVMRADSRVVQEWIQAHRQDLQAALAEQGLHLERLRVATDADARRQQQGQQGRSDPDDERAPRRGREPGEWPAFEVRV